ncbi:MAG TPA: NusG domain II-containing protein [Gammaproteobacteria bacterium]
MRTWPRDWLTFADALVVLGAAALIGTLYVALWSAESAQEVEIWSRGERVETLPLAEDRQLDIHGALGISHIEVRQAQVRFVSSPCSNKVCIHGGWLKHAGETLACLPNQVSVRILGRDRRYDAINF